MRLQRLAAGEGRRVLREDSAPVKDGGGFSLRLALDPGANVFRIEVLDPAGLVVAATSEEITLVRSAVRTVPRTLLRSIGVADHAGKTVRLVPRGKPLPARSEPADGLFYTTRELEPGNAGEALSIPILEGNEERAHLNRAIYDVKIRSESVSRRIPAGSEVEVQVSVSASEEVEILARLPRFDLPLETVTLSLTPTADQVSQKLADLLHDVRLLEEVAVDDDEIAAVVSQVAEDESVDRIRDKLDRAQGEPAAVSSALTDLELLQRKVEPFVERLDHLLPWRRHLERCNGNVTTAAAIVAETPGLPENWLARLDDLSRRYSAAVEARDEEASERLAFIELPELFKEAEPLRARVREQGEGRGSIEGRRTGHLLKGDVQHGSGTV